MDATSLTVIGDANVFPNCGRHGWLTIKESFLTPFIFPAIKTDLLAQPPLKPGMVMLTGLRQFDQEATSLRKAYLETGTSLGLDKVAEQPYLLRIIYL